MKIPTREQVERIRKEYPAGCQVRLIRMTDPQAPKPGTIGEVVGVDDLGDLLMRWPGGSGLKVIIGEDEVEKVED